MGHYSHSILVDTNIMVSTNCSIIGEKSFFIKKIDFPKIKYTNVHYFNLVHAPKPKFFLLLRFIPVPIFFLPLSFPFSPPFYSRFLLRCIFFLAEVKSRVLIMGDLYGQSLEMGPGSIIHKHI